MNRDGVPSAAALPAAPANLPLINQTFDMESTRLPGSLQGISGGVGLGAGHRRKSLACGQISKSLTTVPKDDNIRIGD